VTLLPTPGALAASNFVTDVDANVHALGSTTTSPVHPRKTKGCEERSYIVVDPFIPLRRAISYHTLGLLTEPAMP
jgi:hypothetical protein